MNFIVLSVGQRRMFGRFALMHVGDLDYIPHASLDACTQRRASTHEKVRHLTHGEVWHLTHGEVWHLTHGEVWHLTHGEVWHLTPAPYTRASMHMLLNRCMIRKKRREETDDCGSGRRDS